MLFRSDATMLLDYMLTRTRNILSNLVVFEDKMLQNIELTQGALFAQRVMTLLIDRHEWTREAAYDKVQPLAMTSWQYHVSFKQLCIEHEVLSNDEIEEAFSLEFHLVYVDEIFKRVGLL